MEEGQLAKKPIWKKWWFWGIIIVVLIVIGASSGGDKNKDQGSGSTDGKSTTATSQKTEKPDLEVVDHSITSDQYLKYVSGTVKNNTDKEYSYVQVEINLYDSSGAQVGSTMTNTNNLEPQGAWKFKAMITENNAASYKIKDVTGW